ncbi:MAG: hypothetical protein JXA13_11055 [Anaerolineales bacterium]|nr:hypothetical protein [Anaerolineales bacterium]
MYSTSVSKTLQGGKNTVPIHNGNGKVIGEVEGEVFKKKVKGSLHQLQIPPAWAVDTISIRQAKQAGATKIEIEDKESGAIFRCGMAIFERYGFAFDRGFGSQIGLALAHWMEIEPGNEPPHQLPMFGGLA